MKEKIISLIVLGMLAFALDFALPDLNNWFAFGANAVELTEFVTEIAELDVIVFIVIEFLF